MFSLQLLLEDSPCSPAKHRAAGLFPLASKNCPVLLPPPFHHWHNRSSIKTLLPFQVSNPLEDPKFSSFSTEVTQGKSSHLFSYTAWPASSIIISESKLCHLTSSLSLLFEASSEIKSSEYGESDLSAWSLSSWLPFSFTSDITSKFELFHFTDCFPPSDRQLLFNMADLVLDRSMLSFSHCFLKGRFKHLQQVWWRNY